MVLPQPSDVIPVRARARLAAQSALVRRRSRGPAMPEGPRAEPLRVLVADDCPDLRASLRLVLTLLGYQVVEAADGAAALAAARAFRPHVALVDLAMPRLDGLQVARQIRQDTSLRDALLVAVSGYGQEEDVASARAAGFDHHLLKPFDLDTLQALLGARPHPAGPAEAGPRRLALAPGTEAPGRPDGQPGAP
jgi:CheY-like chemotaxis protein